jgi:hypothetical protein
VSSGKFYWEVTPTDVGAGPNYHLGIQSSAVSAVVGGVTGEILDGYGYYATGQKLSGTTYASYGSSFTNNDVIGVALDMDAGTLVFYKNNVSQGTAFTGIVGSFTPLSMFYTGGAARTSDGSFNLGQRPFTYTPPSGFLALNTFNLPSSTIPAGNKYMDILLYTGTGVAPRTISGVGFQPDLVWTKSRSNASNQAWVDSVRGGNKLLLSDATDSEYTGTWINSFNSDGYVLGDTGSAFNFNGYTYVSWNWKANGTAVTNTAGSITSTVSANTTSGFSVVTYTGTNAIATVGHGLGVAPSLILFKNRSVFTNWIVYSSVIGAGNVLFLDATLGSTANPPAFNSTAPTSSVFSVGAYSNTNGLTNGLVAYCFAPIAGFSAFGSYTGNGSTDGPFIYTGFRPRWILIKVTSTTGSWTIVDTARDTYNLATKGLYADLSNAEDTSRTVDILSNGFKFRSAANNISGETLIYACFAENPFRNALAR